MRERLESEDKGYDKENDEIRDDDVGNDQSNLNDSYDDIEAVDGSNES
jgi:hypothetical protein